MNKPTKIDPNCWEHAQWGTGACHCSYKLDKGYSYQTREFPTVPGDLSDPYKEEMEKLGFIRVWADVTLEKTFVVYRSKEMKG